MEEYNQTELKIIEAAEQVFYQKGKHAASMQDIAEEAGITRTSLNYYYRSKDKLFEAVYRNAFGRFIPRLSEMLNSDEPFKAKIPKIVEILIDSFLENPQIPLFILQEINTNPERISQMMFDLGINPQQTLKIMKDDPFLANLPVDPRQIFMNVLSMCVFPFAGRPIIQPMLYDGDEEAYKEAMQQRKHIIPLMIENMIKSFMS